MRATQGSAEGSAQKATSLVDALLSEIESFDDLETLVIERAIQRCEGNRSAAARLLGMGRGQVDYRLKKRVI
jgi:ActR/RegA family two-component response regulator